MCSRRRFSCMIVIWLNERTPVNTVDMKSLAEVISVHKATIFDPRKRVVFHDSFFNISSVAGGHRSPGKEVGLGLAAQIVVHTGSDHSQGLGSDCSLVEAGDPDLAAHLAAHTVIHSWMAAADNLVEAVDRNSVAVDVVRIPADHSLLAGHYPNLADTAVAGEDTGFGCILHTGWEVGRCTVLEADAQHPGHQQGLAHLTCHKMNQLHPSAFS